MVGVVAVTTIARFRVQLAVLGPTVDRHPLSYYDAYCSFHHCWACSGESFGTNYPSRCRLKMSEQVYLGVVELVLASSQQAEYASSVALLGVVTEIQAQVRLEAAIWV